MVARATNKPTTSVLQWVPSAAAVSTESVIITSCNDISRAAEALRDQISRLFSFDIIMSDNIASPWPMRDARGAILAEGVFGFQGPHDRWWENGQLSLRSPLAQACRYESAPFWANAGGFHTRHPNAYLHELGLEDFERRALVAAAIVIPVHLPFGQIGMAAFGSCDSDPPDMAGLFSRHADTLMLLTHHFISSYAQVSRRRRWLPANCQLTKREVECLRWAAIGKTDREIASIIDRAHSTIRFHIRNAAAKLDSVNRSQSIFKAAQLGYLGHSS